MIDYTQAITFRTQNSVYHLTSPDADGWRALTKEDSDFALSQCRIIGQGHSTFLGVSIESETGKIVCEEQLVLGLPEGSSHPVYATSTVVEVLNS